MRRRTLLYGNTKPSIGKNASACDVVFANELGDKIILKEKDWPDLSKGFTPIGIVVVPGSHNIYGNDTCGVMSLVKMSSSDPENGTVTQESRLWWGGVSKNITTMTNYNKVITTLDNTTNTISGGFTTEVRAYLPIQNYRTGLITRNNAPYAPSPYVNEDYQTGTLNPLYITSESSNRNVLSDFDGFNNTQKMLNEITKQPNWRTDATINNTNDNGVEGYYPSACCCWRYHTVGTNEGEWYLPALGELGYISPKIYDLKTTISNLKTKYPSLRIRRLNESEVFLSSTENSSTNFNYLSVQYNRGQPFSGIFNRPKWVDLNIGSATQVSANAFMRL